MQSNQPSFNLNLGRDMIKNFDTLDADQLQRQQLAMKSFTESIEEDTLFMIEKTNNFNLKNKKHTSNNSYNSIDDDNQLSSFYDSNNDIKYNEVFDDKKSSMKESSTVDTIIEVLNTSNQSQINEALGETQKYTMTVPGPGHLEEEIELHKSLLKNNDNNLYDKEKNDYNYHESDLFNEELQHVIAMTKAAEEALQNKQLSTNINETVSLSNCNVQEEYNKIITSRPRPTTPIIKSTIDLLANKTSDFIKNNSVDQSAKIHVKIPTNTIQKSLSRNNLTITNALSLSIEQPSWQTETNEDLLEINPEYARNAPPKPVVHRRKSIDWENFSEKNEFEENNETNFLNKNFTAKNTIDQFEPILNKQTEKKDCSFEFEYSKNNYNSNNLTNSTKNWMEDNKFENILSGENVIEQFKPQTSAPLSSLPVLDDLTKYSENKQCLPENFDLAEQSSSKTIGKQNSFVLVSSIPGQSLINQQQEINNKLLDNNQFVINNQNYDDYTKNYNKTSFYQPTLCNTYENKINSLNNTNYNCTENYNQSQLISSELKNLTHSKLFPQQIRTPDVFSWEAQENVYANYDSNISSVPVPLPQLPISFNNKDVSKTSTQITKNLTENSSPPSRPKALPPGRPPAPKINTTKKIEEEEEDSWTKFKKITDQVSNIVNATTEQLKKLNETSAANDIKDETYIAKIGGNQGFELNLAQKKNLLLQEEKKKQKANKKSNSPTFDLKKEADIEFQQKELVERMAATHFDLANWKPPSINKSSTSIQNKQNVDNNKETIFFTDNYDIKTDEKQEIKSKELEIALTEEKKEPVVDCQNWTGFDDFNNQQSTFQFPTSNSDFFLKEISKDIKKVDSSDVPEDPFAPIVDSTNNNEFDPFNILSPEEIIAKTRKLIEHEQKLKDKDIASSDALIKSTLSVSRQSSVTLEGPSPVFNDDFYFEENHEDLTPIYDEDDSVPLPNFLELYPTDGWDLMIRHPLKKKIMGDRFWKLCFVRIEGNLILIFNNRKETKPYYEILIQTSYVLSDLVFQPYDTYGKIHTTKLQQIFYKERLGIRAGQISRLVEGHLTKYGLPLEHSAQCLDLAKFGSLNEETILSFVHCIEDILFKSIAKRETIPVYKQDEVQIHCYDEYSAHVDKEGIVSNQKARVRFFCLAFLTGSPYIEIGLNDRRRQGKEIVRRKDILPLYTESWIRFENIEFHNTIEKNTFEQDQVIRYQPLDGCFYEIMRFRVRPPKNRKKPLIVKSIMKICGSKIEITIKVVASSYQQFAKGTAESVRIIPCEDIQIRFPIPEAWIYIFREEKHWGVGTVHSKTRRTGKMKNLRDRLMGTMQNIDSTLIEVAIGEAKYEHIYRSLVWRISRLPEKHHTAYKSHDLKCRFDLSSFDLMPENFLPTCVVEFTMPLATISNTVVRSISIEQHEDSDRVEKFVRYVAKCKYDVEIDYSHCNELNEEIAIAKLPACESVDTFSKQPLKKHVSAFDPKNVNEHYAGYKIELNKTDPTFQNSVNNEFANIQNVGDSNSSDDDNNDKFKVPMVEINMQGYGY